MLGPDEAWSIVRNRWQRIQGWLAPSRLVCKARGKLIYVFLTPRILLCNSLTHLHLFVENWSCDGYCFWPLCAAGIRLNFMFLFAFLTPIIFSTCCLRFDICCRCALIDIGAIFDRLQLMIILARTSDSKIQCCRMYHQTSVPAQKVCK